MVTAILIGIKWNMEAVVISFNFSGGYGYQILLPVFIGFRICLLLRAVCSDILLIYRLSCLFFIFNIYLALYILDINAQFGK